MSARKPRKAPPKKTRRPAKLDEKERALVEWYFARQRKAAST